MRTHDMIFDGNENDDILPKKWSEIYGSAEEGVKTRRSRAYRVCMQYLYANPLSMLVAFY